MDPVQHEQGLIKTAHAKLVDLAVANNGKITSLLEQAFPCIEAFATLVYDATHHGDIEMKEKGSMMLGQSFFGGLVQLANEISSAFQYAFSNCVEMSMHTERAQRWVNELLEDVDDVVYRKEVADNITTNAVACAELASKSFNRFVTVTRLINEIECQFVAGNTYKRDTTDETTSAFALGIKNLSILADRWGDMCKFFSQFASYSKKDLVSGAQASRKGAKSSIIQVQEFTQEVIKMYITLSCVSTLASAFQKVYQLLNPKVRQVQLLMQNTSANRVKFAELVSDCKSLPVFRSILSILGECKENLSEQLKLEIEALQQGRLEGDYNSLMENVVRDETAQDFAIKQESLEPLLVAAPASIALLAQMCLLSASSRDFRISIAHGGFQHVRSDWFRAAIHQVVNCGAAAFVLATNKLSQMERLSHKIPLLAVEIFRLILSGKIEQIKSKLQGKLDIFLQASRSCQNLATEVEKNFDNMINLINELAVAVTATFSIVESKSSNGDGNQATEQPRDAVESFDTMAAINISQIDATTLIKTIKDGLLALIEVRRQWSLLVRFFNSLCVKTRVELFDPAQSHFSSFAKEAAEKINKKLGLSSWVKETLRDRARDMAQKGFQVNMITNMYLDVSARHIRTPLLTLDELLTLTDVAKIQRLLPVVTIKCEQSQKEIKLMATQRVEENFVKFRQLIMDVEEASSQPMDDDEEEDSYYAVDDDEEFCEWDN